MAVDAIGKKSSSMDSYVAFLSGVSESHWLNHIYTPFRTRSEIHSKCHPKPLPLNFFLIIQNLTFTLNSPPDGVFNRVANANGDQTFLLTISFKLLEKFRVGVSSGPLSDRLRKD
jgi:hypothetical protein